MADMFSESSFAFGNFLSPSLPKAFLHFREVQYQPCGHYRIVLCAL